MENKAPAQQFTFSSGILDDPMEARQDLKTYFSGASQLLNFICQPLGGVTLRAGLKTYMEIPEMAGGEKLARFELNAQTGYLCVGTDKKLQIIRDGIVKQSVTTDYSGEDVRSLDFNQSLDTIIITSEKYKTKTLVYKNDTEWTYADADFTAPPQVTFPDTTGGINEKQRLKFSSAAANNSFRLKLEGYQTASIVWSDNVNTNANRIKEVLNGLEILDSVNGGVTVTPNNGEYDVEFVGTDGKKSWEDIIISIEDASDQCRVYTKCIQDGKPPLEDLWSDTRGWPFSSCYYQGRCVFGGCQAKNNLVAISQATQAFSFRQTDELLDDEACLLTADGEGNSHVYRVLGMEKLFAFTDKGVFVVPESPITPATAYTVQHTDIPCAPIRPVAIDGDIIYVTRSNDGVNLSVASISYNYEAEKYKTDDLAILAYSVMRTPIAIDVRRSTRRNNATYLYVVNEDGTLAILNTKKSQELNGWTICNTANGWFRDVCVINDTAFFVVEREILGERRWFIEVWDDESRLDLSVKLSSDTEKSVWTDESLEIYNGLTVGVYANGLAYGEAVVENNTLELDFPVNEIEVGFPFEWDVTTLPVVAELTDGTLIGNRHRLPKVTLRLQNSAGITIGKQKICNRFFGRNNIFSKEQAVINGTVTVRQLGYCGGNRDDLGRIKLTGTSLQPLTLLSITAEVIQ